MIGQGKASAADLDLIHLTDDVDEAVRDHGEAVGRATPSRQVTVRQPGSA